LRIWASARLELDGGAHGLDRLVELTLAHQVHRQDRARDRIRGVERDRAPVRLDCVVESSGRRQGKREIAVGELQVGVDPERMLERVDRAFGGGERQSHTRAQVGHVRFRPEHHEGLGTLAGSAIVTGPRGRVGELRVVQEVGRA